MCVGAVRCGRPWGGRSASMELCEFDELCELMGLYGLDGPCGLTSPPAVRSCPLWSIRPVGTTLRWPSRQLRRRLGRRARLAVASGSPVWQVVRTARALSSVFRRAVRMPCSSAVPQRGASMRAHMPYLSAMSQHSGSNTVAQRAVQGLPNARSHSATAWRTALSGSGLDVAGRPHRSATMSRSVTPSPSHSRSKHPWRDAAPQRRVATFRDNDLLRPGEFAVFLIAAVFLTGSAKVDEVFASRRIGG